MTKETHNTGNKTSRPDFINYVMEVCHTVASRATCLHRDQGAVIVKNYMIVATGYNGAPSEQKDCIEHGNCAKEISQPCRAEGLHGESNAIISAAKNGVSIEGATMYCIYAPCRTCCNMIKNAGIWTVYYEQEYPGFPESAEYLSILGVNVIKAHQ